MTTTESVSSGCVSCGCVVAMKRERSSEDMRGNQKMLEKIGSSKRVAEKTGVIGEGSTTAWAGREPQPLKRKRRDAQCSPFECPSRHSKHEFLKKPPPVDSIVTRGKSTPTSCYQSKYKPREHKPKPASHLMV